jgi:hypothetical protein
MGASFLVDSRNSSASSVPCVVSYTLRHPYYRMPSLGESRKLRLKMRRSPLMKLWNTENPCHKGAVAQKGPWQKLGPSRGSFSWLGTCWILIGPVRVTGEGCEWSR